MDSSIIEFKNVQNKSVLTTQYSVKPLKIVNPITHTKTCHCVLTNYGGGFVQGDTVKLKVNCEEATTSVISSQANTRIYESKNNTCKQELTFNLKNNSFHVFLNDPLVIHKGGHFTQNGYYELEKKAVLLVIDWFSGGRTSNKESYQFREFNSNLEIRIEKKLILKDTFQISPKEMNLDSPASLKNTENFINIYLIGDEDHVAIKLIENKLNTIEEDFKSSKKEVLIANTRINKQAHISRFSAKKHLTLRKLLDDFSQILLHKDLLFFNPLERKY